MAKLLASLRPYTPNSDDPFDAIKAAHLLNGQVLAARPRNRPGPQARADRCGGLAARFPRSGRRGAEPGRSADLSPIEGYPKNFREIQEKMRGMTPMSA
jgi:hypothetical protein